MKKAKVEFTRFAYKSLDWLPVHIRAKVKSWVSDVELLGIREVRKRPGFHDEPLQGVRHGQRSVRLNRSYRLIYFEDFDGSIEVIMVMEVSKHEY